MAGRTQSGVHLRSRHAAGGVNSRSTHLSGFADPIHRLGSLYTGQADVEPLGSPDFTSGMVGTAHILPGSVTKDLFAETIVAPTVESSLPLLPDVDYPEGSLVFLTTDGKLYRNVADAWTTAVDGADIIANSIVSGKIAAGAVGATEIAALSIDTVHFQATARAPEVENSDSSVVIDPSGITILNGKINLLDEGGTSVLGAAGFQGAWLDFLQTRVYNGLFRAGALGVPLTLGGPASQLPYWTVEALTGSLVVQLAADPDGARYLHVTNPDVAVRLVSIVQDVPIVPGQASFAQIDYEVLNVAASSSYAEVTIYELDENLVFVPASNVVEGAVHFSTTALHEDGRAQLRVTSVVNSGSWLRIQVLLELGPGTEMRLNAVYGGSERSILGRVRTFPEGLTSGALNYYELGPDGFRSINYQGDPEVVLSKDSLTFLNGATPGVIISRGGSVNAKLQIEPTVDDDNMWVRIQSGDPAGATTPANSAQLALGRSGEAHDRIFLNTKDETVDDPSLEFGPGSAARDVFLRRGGAGLLILDQDAALGGTGSLFQAASASGYSGIVARRTADGTYPFLAGLNSSGEPVVEVGSGSGARVAAVKRDSSGNITYNGYGRLRFVPYAHTTILDTTTAASVANTLLATGVPSHAKAVQLVVRLNTSAINVGNLVEIRHGALNNIAGILYAPGVATYFNSDQMTCEIDSSQRIRYVITRAAGSLRLLIGVIGYWTDDNG